MCSGFSGQAINLDYMHDLARKRANDQERFNKIWRFAQRRWMATRDLRRAAQWLAVAKSAERRAPYKIIVRS